MPFGMRAQGGSLKFYVISSFRELRVYQAAEEGARQLFLLTKRLPIEEKYSLTSQIRRASRSVHAHIVEAWRKRRYPASFVSKLSDSDAEAAEVQSWHDSVQGCVRYSSGAASEPPPQSVLGVLGVPCSPLPNRISIVKKNGKVDHHKALTGDDLIEFVDGKLFSYLAKFKTAAERSDSIVTNS